MDLESQEESTAAENRFHGKIAIVTGGASGRYSPLDKLFKVVQIFENERGVTFTIALGYASLQELGWLPSSVWLKKGLQLLCLITTRRQERRLYLTLA